MASRSTSLHRDRFKRATFRLEAEADIVPGIPLGRLGKPEDVADAIVFVASEQARWLTGQLLYVGGGWRMGQ